MSDIDDFREDRYEDSNTQNSMTPALDKVMEGGEATPEDYTTAALEAYDLMGMALSEVGSMYLLMGSMLGAIKPKEEDAGV